ncbi:phosphoadenylyl-sulfate reductase [Bacillus paralicheniformis]|jgi:phosphoadenosine phosphosulfate reductase|uniref:Adenosine 5'-phosphosulfate reductase n=1 Tax=Bacillus paralicheniformis TaxID=1648923 RepID=A0A6N2FBI0_9BACI|nr:MULTISPECIES: phosphoadenylyl-sulfate reductase [Bacillus]ETB72335.1 phosphoadenosine phosphosulfate reductase [Bacillus sp. CPSM8]KJD53273.1 phosphoadenosine phosphosulfate reductase [Bacillus amyloliquefaciens]KUL07900.1 phosphoadenosine phosphosulfate reductase [Bacillus licheniformis LMG 7559]KUL14984.1 phosphoadenosine phosphosulfate reductase [Bacillus licheniformis LMG 6934]MBC8623521.1 phosphoadenylyl-sulfate reductase [Robertmurraya crescens]
MNDVLTYHTWNEKASEEVMDTFSGEMDVLKWAYSTYQKIVYACSFGAEGIVLIDLISKVVKEADIVFLDTGLHFPETYELINEVKDRYPGLSIRFLKPGLSLEEQEKRYGSELWKRHPDHCCRLRKIEPLREHLSGMEAWMTGLRREQSETRKHVRYINKDDNFKLIKICPLIHWTWEDVWTYIKLNQLTYHKLHDQDYPSIGCEVCTSPVADGGNLRAGRWARQEKTECGLHQFR